jgi:hypothetical protein
MSELQVTYNLSKFRQLDLSSVVSGHRSIWHPLYSSWELAAKLLLRYHNWRQPRNTSERWLEFWLKYGSINPNHEAGKSVSIETRITGGRAGFGSRQREWHDFFSSLPRSGRLWGSPSLLSNRNQEHIPPGVKRPDREPDHSPPSSAEVKNAWSYAFTPPIRLHVVVLSRAQG